MRRGLHARLLAESYIGQKFGRWTILGVSAEIHKKRHIRFDCVCDCGNRKTVAKIYVIRGESKSCGCLNTETRKTAPVTHGMARKGNRSKAYLVWAHIKTRCNNPKNKDYKYYGGRGITVCDRWLSFENFFADMGDCPEGLEIDRIDNNKGYEPGNCRWTDHTTNCRNFRRNRLITYEGRTLSLTEWSTITGMNSNTIRQRLDRGWTPEQTFTIPCDGWAVRRMGL